MSQAGQKSKFEEDCNFVPNIIIDCQLSMFGLFKLKKGE